jgi:hypothetical protein
MKMLRTLDTHSAEMYRYTMSSVQFYYCAGPLGNNWG